jgi:hypothetical protein
MTFGRVLNLDQSRDQNRVLRAYIYLILSLCAHALIWLVVLKADLVLRLLPDPSQVFYKRPESAKNVEVVLLEDSPNAMNLTDDKPAFLAQKNQRVLEQTQARFKGETENKEFLSYSRPQQRAEKIQQEAVTQNDGDIDVKATERLNKALSSGISTLSESLPENIKFGDFTALNTDQYLYFSFFNRIASRIRFNWENGVASVVEDLALRNFQLHNKRTFSTEVEVRLDPKGYLQGISIYRASGIQGLDLAVARAFELSTPFINPPAEMVKADGLIHL